MPPKSKPSNPPDTRPLINLTKSTQILLSHYQSSLLPAKLSSSSNVSSTSSSSTTTTSNPLDTIKATTTLLRSHTTTLSLLLLTPPFTPTAVATKLSDVTMKSLTNMVNAAASPSGMGALMRSEVSAGVRRVLSAWGKLLALVGRLAEKGAVAEAEAEKQEVLSITGVVWEACDALLKICQDGVVGVVVRKAEGFRAVLLDAVEELKEWGEDVDDEEGDAAEGSDGEGGNEFADEDEIFGAANKLGKGDKELKALLDTSVKRLKMVGIFYQALIKRRLKTFPSPTSSATNGETADGTQTDPTTKLEQLMDLLKTIPDTIDDLASAFYDLNEDEAKETLDQCCSEAKRAAEIVKQSWTGQDDEFTAWAGKFISALEAA
ncbi:hypothetical protein BU24DRAFT_365350 [Aaosphaeria arxii CBS 175.79]|uniref:Cyclin-D1-binding protein 1-like N-terminal domain-containing protein n=1 Tax=Aaosphaeria arxii CBS 175.79 TaxID=1450172 RepID=A0A6A5Y4I1_9PLEO|nr:uncharacterized protein BU24DRAFT_365350 [Aaosphaeria arxii CBS 175.79]KAF2019700.1 hypothetical protein BU24DRAFT_365350 [Aaosphaeria arxii CBS 175.79]